MSRNKNKYRDKANRLRQQQLHHEGNDARAFVNADEAVQKALREWVESKKTYHLDPGWTGWCRAELDMAKADALKRFKELYGSQQ
jgi:hypothetical protein|tara:strand:+ start:566 stop:820 length:255 start_codon:yes stop_codon:yes gene_type:complete